MGIIIKNNPWRGVAFDLDGTLLSADHTISNEMRDLCAELALHGIWVTIASARPSRSVCSIAASLDLSGPYVALNGAVVVASDLSTVELIPIPQADAACLIERYRHDPRTSLNVYTAQDWFVQRLDQQVKKEAIAVGYEPSSLPAAFDASGIAKILLISSPEEVETVLAETLLFSNPLTVLRSAPTYIEITAKDATKADGLRTAAAVRKIYLRDMVAAGDGENDLPMLAASGFSIAMEHAPLTLRTAASKVVGSNNDGSLANAIRELCLPQSY